MPFYQIRFGERHPLDLARVRVARRVFHMPRLSLFVSVAELRRLRGSDASNVHDEEPADHELEFSDDEAEAAHRARAKQQYVFRADGARAVLIVPVDVRVRRRRRRAMRRQRWRRCATRTWRAVA
jgi:hypothetical protein